MAHFAKIENGIITQVVVVNNDVLENKPVPESEAIGVAFANRYTAQIRNGSRLPTMEVSEVSMPVLV